MKFTTLLVMTLGISIGILGSAATATNRITIAAPKLMSMALLLVAQDQGFFAKHGQEVDLVLTSTGLEASRRMIAGEFDLAAAYDTVILRNHLNGTNQEIYCRLHSAKNNTGIVARVDRGINDPRDLKGKKIAVAPGTSAQYFLEDFLESNRLDKKKTSILFIPPSEYVTNLENGVVDAVATWEPNISTLQSSSKIETVTFYSDFYQENSFLIGRKGSGATQSQRIKGVLAGLNDADDYIAKNPEKAFAIVIAAMGAGSSAKMKLAWKEHEYDMSVTNRLVGRLNLQKDWLSNQMEEKLPATTRIMDDFYLDPLAETSPYLVTVERRTK